MVYEPEDLLALADAYCQATGDTLWALGAQAAGNTKLFLRLRAGKGCNLLTARRAGNWFVANWPSGLSWPNGVEQPLQGAEAA